MALYINNVKFKLKIKKLIKFTGTSYNKQSNTFMLISYKLEANSWYPYAREKKYVLSSALKTSRDENSLIYLGSALHSNGPTLENYFEL